MLFEVIFQSVNRRVDMENKKVMQFEQDAYEHGRAKKNFDNWLVGGVVNGLVVIGLLVIDFYRIPYVFSGIRPYIIQLGCILFPVFVIGTCVSWYRFKLNAENFEKAKLEMLEDLYQRINNLD